MNTLHINSPLLKSDPIAKIAGRDVFLKMDALQPSGSFKIRGIGYACQKAYASGARLFVAASGGNAGLAVAYAAKQLGAHAIIVVPKRAAEEMQKRIRDQGAELIVHGDVWDDSHAYALELSQTQGARYIHPFDDPDVWQGHATLIEEFVAAQHKPDAIVLSVGGGGLMCGVIQGLHAAGWNDIPVIAVETDGAATLARSIAAKRRIVLDELTSIATTLSARAVAPQAFAWTKKHQIIPVTVSDRLAVEACKSLLNHHQILVEPACGASLAVVYSQLPCIEAFNSVTVIVCGGAGISHDLLQKWDLSLPVTT